ncbi:hypothetical protein LWI28_025552 [Acer negundo]|uniref:Uncharacterized protein n=1 Tax=Acer negundo TaxID=4023 RepID=A0AAD5NG98_ACENE|nr:hypothetical protein LWI28_025552 [Acer negundo]
MKKGYTNMQYPLLDPFERARLERYIRVSVALPVTGSPNSSGTGGLVLPSSTSHVPSPPPISSSSNTAKVTTGSTQLDADPIPPPVTTKSHAKTHIPHPTSARSLARTPTRVSSHTSGCPSIKTRKVTAPLTVGTPPIPSSPAVVPSKEQPGITEKEGALVSYPTADVPSRSGSGAAKVASVLAEGFKFALAMEKQLLTLKEGYIGLQARLKDTQQELVQAQQKVILVEEEEEEEEEEDDPTGIVVSEVEADGMAAKEEEDAIAGSKVPAIEETQPDMQLR